MTTAAAALMMMVRMMVVVAERSVQWLGLITVGFVEIAVVVQPIAVEIVPL